MYTVKEISKKLNVSEEQVRRWCRNGNLKCIKDSRKKGFIIKESDFMIFLDNNPKYKVLFNGFVNDDNTDYKEILYSLEQLLKRKKKEIKELEIAINHLKGLD